MKEEKDEAQRLYERLMKRQLELASRNDELEDQARVLRKEKKNLESEQ